ncbi:MAG: PhoX family protein [Burkholderiales bacterium]
MKGNSHPKNDVSLNPSAGRSILDVIDTVDQGRRRFIMKSGVGAAALASAGGLTLGGLVSTVEAAPVPPGIGFPGFGFSMVSASTNLFPGANTDTVAVPAGYTAQLFAAWGDPIMPGAPAFLADASQSAADQAKQFGMHNDGMHFFPFTGVGGPSNDRGLLCVNNEYTHEAILHVGGQGAGAAYTIAKTRKSQAGHGVSVVEARRIAGKWTVVKNSPYGRRITSNTPMRISGPAAGHALMKANAYTITDAGSVPTGGLTDGFSVNGTINNCAHGITPWGTYLTCEENYNGNFGSSAAVDTSTANETSKLRRRYGISASGFGYRWHENDPRFDVNLNPNEPNLFGWVVEIDPFAPTSMPVKRTALGRFKHESAQYVVDRDNRVAFYQGDDERNEYIYKFVCAGTFNPTNRAANRNLLDSGTLYVAKFNSGVGSLTGVWIPLVPGTIGLNGQALRDNPNFSGANDAEVLAKILIKARMAADAVGATMMDRPEWTGVRPRILGYSEVEIYCTLTNNNRRGSAAVPTSNAADGSTSAGSARPAMDAANPRADNVHGHIIRWREAGKSVAALTFEWDLFVQCGDTITTRVAHASGTNNYTGNIVDADAAGTADYGAPDGLWFDQFGRLWVQTDQQGDALGDVWQNIGRNVMVCADPNTGSTRRFLTGPNQSEVTGVVMTPDGKTMFVGIQHPGEDATAAAPEQFSAWPHSQFAVESDGVTLLPAGRPRSSVVVITKDDGGIIGT